MYIRYSKGVVTHYAQNRFLLSRSQRPSNKTERTKRDRGPYHVPQTPNPNSETSPVLTFPRLA